MFLFFRRNQTCWTVHLRPHTHWGVYMCAVLPSAAHSPQCNSFYLSLHHPEGCLWTGSSKKLFVFQSYRAPSIHTERSVALSTWRSVYHLFRVPNVEPEAHGAAVQFTELLLLNWKHMHDINMTFIAHSARRLLRINLDLDEWWSFSRKKILSPGALIGL